MTIDYQKGLVKRTLAKLTKSQKLKAELLDYLAKEKPHLLRHSARANRIRECCNMVTFRRNIETGEKQLLSANFCKYDRICIACATKRAIKMIKRFECGVKQYGLYDKKRYYVVLTIKHTKSDSLSFLLDKLMEAKAQLARNYRNSKRSAQKNKSFFHYFDGMVISVEVSHKGKHGWHPHINILACSDVDIPIEKGKYYRGTTNEQLKQEWLTITGDSYVHNIRHIDVTSNYFSRSGIGEVFKYAIKFSDLTVPQLAEVMDIQYQKKYRFFSTYGAFRGWSFDVDCSDHGSWRQGVYMYDELEEVYSYKN